MRPPSTIGAVLVSACFFGCEPAQPAMIQTATDFVTMLDYAAAGHARATSYVERNCADVVSRQEGAAGPGIPMRQLDALATARHAVVRVTVTCPDDNVEHGSGVLIEAGRYVLTAGHVLRPLALHPEASIEVYLRERLDTRGHSNRLFAARALKWVATDAAPEVDWCVLEIIDPAGGMPSVRLASPAAGQTCFIYGFPQGVGVTGEGRVTYWTPNDHFDPLLIVARASEDNGVWFEPVAGCLSLGGMSGGPVFDSSGAVVALITGHRRDLDRGTARHSLRTTSLAAARAFLEAR